MDNQITTSDLEVLERELGWLARMQHEDPNCYLQVLLIRAGESKVDYDAKVSLSLQNIIEQAKQMAHAEETSRALNSIKDLLNNSKMEYAILPHRLLYREPILARYRAVSLQLTDGTRVPQQEVDTFVIVEMKRESVVAFITGTTMFSIWIDGVRTAHSLFSEEYSSGPIMLGGIQPCFRNEQASDIRPGWRECCFTQGFFEVAGLVNKQLTKQDIDCLLLEKIIEFGCQAGINPSAIRLRVNNCRGVLFKAIGEAVSLADKKEFGEKYLNEMAVARAQGDVSRWSVLQNRALALINSRQEALGSAVTFLRQILDGNGYSRRFLQQRVPDAYNELMLLEQTIKRVALKWPDCSIEVDCLSVRTAYDCLTIQLDVCESNKKYIEIGGGGAHPSAFRLGWEEIMKKPAPPNLYICGFAFGVKRLNTTLAECV